MFVLLALASCKTPNNIAYFQDASSSAEMRMKSIEMFRLRPEDKVNIIVNSKEPELEALFNLTSNGQHSILGANAIPRTVAGKGALTGQVTPIAYTVNSEGNIDFPILGTIKAEGMTRQELAAFIKGRLIGERLVNDAVVTVEYVNMCVSVLGEVARPGRMDINKDHYTILDAIAEAGDLTINGQRENVMVFRQIGDVQHTYTINMCSQQDMLASPAYYLQQNDVVYVTPNDKRKRDSTVEGNIFTNPSFWLSVASLLTTVTLTIATIISKK